MTQTADATTAELACMLVERRRLLNQSEAEWLRWLAEFDRRGGWALDGHTGCVPWLVHRCGMAYSTAKERLRVALELTRRPVLAGAFAAGEFSYSKVRVLTRVEGADEEADTVFVQAAGLHTASDLEVLARHYRLNRDQDVAVPEQHHWEKRGVRVLGRCGGMSTIEAVVAVADEARIMRILDAAVDVLRDRPVDKAPAGAPSTPGPVQPVDEAPAGAADARPTWTQRRADALCQLLDAGLAHLAGNGEVSMERAVVNVVVDYDTLVEHANGDGTVDGIPLSGDAVRRLACDAGLVRIVTRGASEVLDLGRKQRHWNEAQRRAIRYRYSGRCAYPGCGYRITQIHHCRPWRKDGRTDLDAGVPLCHCHHHLVHDGRWTVAYNPLTRTITFTAPDGRRVEAATPAALRAA